MKTTYFILATGDVILGVLNILSRNYWLGIMLFVCALLLSFNVRDKNNDINRDS